MRRSLIPLLVVMLASLLALAACGSTAASNAVSNPPSAATATRPAKAAACNGVMTINQALSSLSDINASATVGDVKAVQAKVAKAVTTVQAHVTTNQEGIVSQISAANAKLTEKLAGYPDTTPIGQTSTTVQDIKTKAADVQNKTAQLASALNCTP
jgi:hypothetical protein